MKRNNITENNELKLKDRDSKAAINGLRSIKDINNFDLRFIYLFKV